MLCKVLDCVLRGFLGLDGIRAPIGRIERNRWQNKAPDKGIGA